MFVIINFNLGNLGSLTNMFKKIGFEAKIESDASTISKAKKLVFFVLKNKFNKTKH